MGKRAFILILTIIYLIFLFVFVQGKILPSHDNLIYDGENMSAPLENSICINDPYMQSAELFGLNSGTGLKLSPDAWHSPYFKIFCGKEERLDLTKYTTLEFFIRTESGVSNSYNIWLNTWLAPLTFGSVDSPKLNIASFVSGGTIDNSFRKVSIPLSNLRSPLWDLLNTESIIFDSSLSNQIYYIDNITFIYNQSVPFLCTEVWSCTPFDACLLSQQNRTCTDSNNCGTSNNKPSTSRSCYIGYNEVSEVKIISQNVIKVTSSGRFDMNDVLNLSNYKLNSLNDPNFTFDVFPINVGREYYLEGFSGNYLLGNLSEPINAFNLYLIFNKNMSSGKDYVLTINNIRDDKQNNFPFAEYISFNFNDNIITGSVKANQVGYLPNSKKFAYIGNYLGDVGPMEIYPKTCEIVNSNSNQVVLTVQANFRNNDSRIMTGEKLYDCDFSSLNEEGKYFVRVLGYGRTYDFIVGNEVYNDVYYKTIRAFYYQRAGISIDREHGGIWEREGGHIQTDERAMIHSSQINSPLYNGEIINSTVNLSHGWYDAGDYGKYVASASIALFQLLSAYEIAPNNFLDNQLNIPESGNGIPDILDESKWEIDWLKNMQASDGGVYHKVATTQWATTMPAQDNAIRWISEKSTHATAQYAAILAKASAIYRPFNSSYADELLLNAEKSWKYLEAHPVTYAFSSEGIGVNPIGIGGGENSDVDNASDDRAWAAAELYKATGKEEYNIAFSKYWNIALANENYDVYGNHAQFKAAYTYATIPKYKNYSTNDTFIGYLKNYIKVGFADEILKRNNNSAYRSGMNDDSYNYIGFGAFSQSSRYAWTLILTNNLINDSKYLEYAKLNLDVQLGTNPQYKSYITGVGYDYPLDPLSTISALDGIKEPFPGVPVYGIQYWGSEANSYNTVAQSTLNLYPNMAREAFPNYSNFRPVLRRYYDLRNLVEMGEYTIVDLAYTAAIYGVLSNGVYQNNSQNSSNPLLIDGVCGVTINACLTGNYNDSIDLSNEYIWECLGINNGIDVICSLPFIYNPPSTNGGSSRNSNGNVNMTLNNSNQVITKIKNNFITISNYTNETSDLPIEEQISLNEIIENPLKNIKYVIYFNFIIIVIIVIILLSAFTIYYILRPLKEKLKKFV